MGQIDPKYGIGTLVNHVAEGDNPKHAHLSPIYQTSTFSFPDVATGAALFKGEEHGFIYTRLGNPNLEQIARKYAALEGLDLLRANPQTPPEKLVDALVFSSGMAAVSAAVLGYVHSGDTVIAQEAVYGGTYSLLLDLAKRFELNVVWLHDLSLDAWEAAFQAHPEARLAYAETPANPTMDIVDLAGLAEIAHHYNAWLMVDNTFATPCCQRPLTLGADVVIHSTTKYLSGHGQIVGGTVISSHVDYVHGGLYSMLKLLGGSPSPFDCWLADIGLKTLEIRMQAHCRNAMQVARFLETHPKVERTYYPGLESNPGYAVAKKQMSDFGGMIAFELKGGMKAGEALMNHVQLATLAVSLGNVDTLIQHPASMTHAGVPAEARLSAGITDGLVRLSVGIENVEDIIADLDQALSFA